MQGRKGGCPREACFRAWATWPAISLALSYARRSTIRKEWWFSSRMVHSSDGGEGPSHVQLHDELAVQLAEDAGANAGDKENPELLQVGVAVSERGISSGAMRTIQGSLWSGKTAGRSSISMIRVGGLRGY